MRGQRHSADQWAAWLEEFQRGDLTIAEDNVLIVAHI